MKSERPGVFSESGIVGGGRVAVFARRFQAPIVPLFIRQRDDGHGHVVCIGEMFYYEEDTGTARDDLDPGRRRS